MSTASIMLVRGVFHTAHGATAIPGWETGLAVVVAILLLLGGLVIGVLGILRQPREAGGEDSDCGPGRGPRRWPPDRPRQPEGGPTWWPEFEREFAAYLALQSAGVR